MNKIKNIPQGYKDSSLGIIPKEWEVKRLGEVCDIDKQSLSSSTDPEYEFYYISLSDVNSERFEIKSSRQVFKTAPSRARRIIKKGDVVISTVRPNLQAFTFIRENVKDVIVSTGFAVLTPKKILGEYLFQYLFSQLVTKQFYQLVVGSNYPAVNSSDVSHLKISVPPLIEQQSIVSVISLWNTAIEKQSELIDQLKLRKHALMQQLLTGKKRRPGFSGTWKRIKLRDIAERITRKNDEDNKNVVTISAQKGFVVQTDFFNKSVASETLDNYFLVYKDEFCYNKSYSNGYPMGAIKRLKSFDKAVVTTLYICFKLKNITSVNIDFFDQYCESGIFNKELVKVANEGGRAHGLLNVTPSDFFNMHMGIPNIDEQNAIATVLVNADKEIELANVKLANLQSQKRGLMQQLLTGNKRIVL